MGKATCFVGGCGRSVEARGWCHKHYENWRRTGEAVRARTPEQRFWLCVEKSDDCWRWVGLLDGYGYGRFFAAGKGLRAHRFAYEVLVGPIPVGLELDHLCRNPSCVCPDHLEAVDHATNVRRGVAAAAVKRAAEQRTVCRKGHERTAENTYHSPDGRRHCRRCRRCQERQRCA